MKTIKGGDPLLPGTPEFTKLVADTKDVGVSNNFNKAMSPPGWLDDNKVNHCMNCETVFGIFTRKHHCRNCGGIFCSTCSGYEKLFLDGATHRVCEFCNDYTNDTITITINTLMGNANIYTVSNSITIEELKTKIYEKRGIPVDEQRLIHDGTDTEDSRTLYSLGIVDGTTLHLTLKLSEAAKAEAAMEEVSSVEAGDTRSPALEEPISILILGRTIDEQLKSGDNTCATLREKLEINGDKKVIIHFLDNASDATNETNEIENTTLVGINQGWAQYFDTKPTTYNFILNDSLTAVMINELNIKLMSLLKDGGSCYIQDILDMNIGSENTYLELYKENINNGETSHFMVVERKLPNYTDINTSEEIKKISVLGRGGAPEITPLNKFISNTGLDSNQVKLTKLTIDSFPLIHGNHEKPQSHFPYYYKWVKS